MNDAVKGTSVGPLGAALKQLWKASKCDEIARDPIAIGEHDSASTHVHVVVLAVSQSAGSTSFSLAPTRLYCTVPFALGIRCCLCGSESVSDTRTVQYVYAHI